MPGLGGRRFIAEKLRGLVHMAACAVSANQASCSQAQRGSIPSLGKERGGALPTRRAFPTFESPSYARPFAQSRSVNVPTLKWRNMPYL